MKILGYVVFTAIVGAAGFFGYRYFTGGSLLNGESSDSNIKVPGNVPLDVLTFRRRHV